MQAFLSQARTLTVKPARLGSIRLCGPISTPGPGHYRRRNLTTMATPSNLQLFVIWAPDYTDEEAFARRLAVREQHLARAEENKKKGYVTRIAGPFLTPESIATPDAPKKLVGSMLLVRATSLDEVRANVEIDVYWINNVWDKEKLVIAPFMLPMDPDEQGGGL